MVETVLGWFWALCIFSVVVALIIALVVIAFSPVWAALYFIAGWYERRGKRKSAGGIRKTSQVGTGVSSEECSGVQSS